MEKQKKNLSNPEILDKIWKLYEKPSVEKNKNWHLYWQFQKNKQLSIKKTTTLKKINKKMEKRHLKRIKFSKRPQNAT